MGKRTGQLAGLAALGALGYMLSRDKKDESSKSETRSSAPSAAPSAAQVSVKEEDNYPDESRRGRMASPPQSIPNTVVAAPVKRSTVTPSSLNSPPATSTYVPVAPERGSLRGPSAAQLREHEASRYPDESRRGRMASANESGAGQRVSAPGDVPGAFEAVDRYHKETTGGTAPYAEGRYPMTKPQPTENTYSRTTGAEAGEAEAYKNATDRFKKETAGKNPAIAQGRAPLTKRQPATNTYTRGMGAKAGEAEAYRAAKAREQAERAGLGVMKKGGAVKKMASGGMTVSKASSRADGIAQRGKTRGKLY